MGDQSQGNGTPEVPQGDDAPKYVTEEQLNKAITARFGEFTKKSNAVLDDKFSGFEKKLVELLPKTPEPGTPPSDDKSIENHPLFKGMAKKLGDVEERLRLSDERVATEQKRTKDLSLRQHVGEALAKANVKDATRAKHATSFIINNGLAKWDESGESMVFTGDDGDVDFETGFKGWLKTDDAKLYLPSPDAAQTLQGRQQQQRVSPSGGPPPNLATLSFEDKLALTAQQLEKQGVGF
jgi:hypothetical protein